MPIPTFKLRRRWVRVSLFAVLAAALGAALWLVVFPERTATFAARQWLPSLGLENADLRFESIGTGAAEVVDIVASDPGWSLRVDSARVEYALAEAIKRRRAKTLLIDGARVVVQRDFLEALAKGEKETAAEEPFDLSALFDAPIDAVTFTNGELTIVDADLAPLAFKWTAAHERTGDGKARLIARLTGDGLGLTVTADANREGRIEVSVESEFAELTGLLSSILPAWRSIAGLPPELSMDLGTVRLSAKAVANADLSLESAEATVLLASLIGEYDGSTASARDVEAKLGLDRQFRIRGSIAGQLLEVQSEEAVLPGQAFGLSFASDDFERWRIDEVLPIRWIYDVDTASGMVTNVEAMVTAADGGALALSGSARLEETLASDYRIASFPILFEGDLDAVRFEIDRVESLDWPSAALAKGSGVIAFMPSGATRVEYAATLQENAFTAFDPELRSTSFGFALTVDSDEEILAIRAKFDALPNRDGMLLRRGDDIVVRSKFALEAVGRNEGDGLLWDGEINWTLPDLSLEGVGWKASGAAAQGKLSALGLEEALLTADEVDVAALASHLGDVLSGSVEWTCREAVGPNLQAQWMGGSLAVGMGVAEADTPLQARAQFAAGVVTLAGERVQQLNLGATSSGDFTTLATSGELTFRYEGLDGTARFQQTAERLLQEDLAVAGDFRLEPLVFDYSDLLSRKIAALEGLSFSASIEAAGRYWLDAEGPDAALGLKLGAGSISYPPSQLTIDGIEIGVEVDSALARTTRPGASSVTFQALRFGDLSASDGRARFDVEPDLQLQLREARLEALGGVLGLQAATIDLSAPGYEGRLNFDRLSLEQIARQISFFDGSMEGSISGYLPVVYKDGAIGSGEGFLGLSPGTSAALRYNADGLLTSDTPTNEKPDLGTRLLRWLKLEPENLVEESLSDLKISAMKIELLPKDAPLTPIRIEIAGEANPSAMTVPLNLRIDVNGTLEELLNFLTRINSLGSVSF